MPTAQYALSIHGLSLSLRCRDLGLLTQVDGAWGMFRAGAITPDFRLSMRICAPAAWPGPSPDLHIRWHGRLPDGLEMTYAVSPARRRYRVEDSACLDADFLAGRGELFVAPGREWTFRHTCLLPMLCELLARRGQHVIHAGCLAGGPPDSRKAILICGKSGTGKTTTTLALARTGLSLLTDDAAFLRFASEDNPLVWGLREPAKVHNRTLALLPWLNEAPRANASTPDEYLVDARGLLPPSREESPPAALIFLEPRNDQRHRLEPLAPLAALERLVRENVRPVVPADDESARNAFRALTRLTARRPGFTLSVGPAIETLRETLGPLL